MANCLIKDSEYWTKLALSGIPELRFYAFASLFVEKYGRFPNLDEIPGSNSSLHLADTIHINDNGSAKIEDILATTGVNNVEEANVILNDQHSDLEIKVTPMNKEAIVEIKRRPSQYEAGNSVEFEIDENVNTGVLFNLMFDKLRKLYGINLIPITNKELQTWKNIPDVKNISAFIYLNNIYINTDIAGVDAPIHEMTHFLLGSIRFKNPELYFELIKIADLFESFNNIARNYPNRTQSDVYEEVFVHEVAKYLANLPSAITKLDLKIQYELNYNIKRLLDSVLMGKYSVKSFEEGELYKMSLRDLAKSVLSLMLTSENLGSLDDALLHRIMANKKSDLMKKGDLKEECQ